MACIQLFSPHLNTPWVYQHIKKTVQPVSTVSTYSSCKLWRRLRHKAIQKHGRLIASIGIQHRIHAWKLICHLGYPGFQAFCTARYLRSARVTNEQVYALYRQSAHLPEPQKSRCRSQLQKIFRFRKIPIPGSRQPLVIPFLATDDFKPLFQTWLLRQLRQIEHQLMPCHYPKATIVQGKSITMAMILFNWKTWMTIMTF